MSFCNGKHPIPIPAVDGNEKYCKTKKLRVENLPPSCSVRSAKFQPRASTRYAASRRRIQSSVNRPCAHALHEVAKVLLRCLLDRMGTFRQVHAMQLRKLYNDEQKTRNYEGKL